MTSATDFFLSVYPHVWCLLAFGCSARYGKPLFGSDETTDSQQDKLNLLAPSQFVFCVWPFLLWSASTSIKVIERGEVAIVRDAFVHILDETRRYFGLVIHLLVLFAVALAISMLWLLFSSGHWPYLTLAALVPVWCLALPSYVELEGRCLWRVQDAIDMIQFTMDKLVLRLCFVWLTAAIVFSLLDALQLVMGEYLSFAGYALVMGLVVAAAVAVYIQTRDPVVVWVAMWCTVGLVMRKTELKGDAKETFDKLQVAASVVAPLFVIVLFIATTQGFYDFFANVSGL